MIYQIISCKQFLLSFFLKTIDKRALAEETHLEKVNTKRLIMLMVSIKGSDEICNVLK